MKKFLSVIACFIFVQALGFASASAQASSSTERASYLAGLGRVIPPEEILIDSYIAQSDYDYPFPNTGALQVIHAAGAKDNTAYLLTGLRGKKEDFSVLPPLNISFVIDISGSMAAQNRLDWVKEAFNIFIDRIRPIDFVSVVIFDNIAEVFIESGRIEKQNDRSQFKKKLDTLRPRGGTNVYAGMDLGYQQVDLNYRPEFTNMVILLTDGMDGSGKSRKEFLDINRRYKERGVSISTIALGADADISLMMDLANEGGGSFRFISDRVVMEQAFGSELDRLMVTAARKIEMQIILADGVTLNETWGYSNWVRDKTIHYSIDTLHNGDYETILAEVILDRPAQSGTLLGNFFFSYEDIAGNVIGEGPFPIVIGSVSSGLISDPRVREAEGYLTLARGLIDIGNRTLNINRLQRELRNSGDSDLSASRQTIIEELDYCLEITRSLRSYLETVNNSFGGGKYGSEIIILNDYETSFTRTRETHLAAED